MARTRHEYTLDKGNGGVGYISQSGISAKYSFLEIWNPVASGVILKVSNILLSVGSATRLVMGFNDSDKGYTEIGAENVVSGLSGVQGVIRGGTLATPTVDRPIGEVKFGIDVPAQLATTPLFISPGDGLLVYAVTTNVAIRGIIGWSEIDE